jgi:hypothetical protein
MDNALVEILVHYCEYCKFQKYSTPRSKNFVLGIYQNLHGILFDARYSELITLQ